MRKTWINRSRYYESLGRFNNRGEWRNHAKAVFEAFHGANQLQYVRRYSACILDAQESHACPSRDHRCERLEIQDHDELCCFPDGERLIISHPYIARQYFVGNEVWRGALRELAKWRDEVPTLSAVDGGLHRSWYYPGHARLVFIGTLQALSRVNLDYEVPTDTTPAEYHLTDDADDALEPRIGSPLD